MVPFTQSSSLLCVSLLATTSAFAFQPKTTYSLASTSLKMASDPLGKTTGLEALDWDFPGQFGGDSIRIEGATLRTCPTGSNDRILFNLKSNARRPMKADLHLTQGPEYIPWKLSVYSEDGANFPYTGIIETPYQPHNLHVYNQAGGMEMPIDGTVLTDGGSGSLGKLPEAIKGNTEMLQGKAIRYWTFEPGTKKIQILLNTEGRHLKAKVEVLEGPNNVKSFFEVYSSNGYKRPLYLVADASKMKGCRIRITNECTIQYPLNAAVEALE